MSDDSVTQFIVAVPGHGHGDEGRDRALAELRAKVSSAGAGAMLSRCRRSRR